MLKPAAHCGPTCPRVRSQTLQNPEATTMSTDASVGSALEREVNRNVGGMPAGPPPLVPKADEVAVETVGDITVDRPRMSARAVDVYYADKPAILNVSLDIGQNEVLAMIGPSGCGKSTFLRCLNRMNDIIDVCRVTGRIELDGEDIYERNVDVVQLRARVGMVFQKPNPFPKSIYDNVAYGPRIHGFANNRSELDDIVQSSLERAGLWNEVRDRMNESGTSLSGGQQQRLCIARAIAVSPEVILMDEPCSALDPIATARIEELIDELRRNYTIAIVTHSMQQAAARLAAHRILPPRQAHRGGRDQPDIHQPETQAHGRLHHRPIRLNG